MRCVLVSRLFSSTGVVLAVSASTCAGCLQLLLDALLRETVLDLGEVGGGALGLIPDASWGGGGSGRERGRKKSRE